MNARVIAGALLEARATGKRLAELPEPLRPTSLEDVYAIHSEIASQSSPIDGWKVGNSPVSDGFAFAPIFQGQVLKSPTHLSDRAFRGRLIEIEIGFVCVRSPEAGVDPERILDYLSPVITFEVICGRFVDMSSISKLELLSDSNCCGAIIVGDHLAIDIIDTNQPIGVSAYFDRFTVQSSQLDLKGATERAAWLVSELDRRHMNIDVEQIIVTGSQAAPALVSSRAEVITINDEHVSVSFV